MSSKAYAKNLVRQSTGKDVPDLLRELYVEKRHTQAEIAESLDVSRDTIVRWLSEYGISRDDRVSLEPLVDVA
jgi:DNA-binding XRE family transcriptional regulator